MQYIGYVLYNPESHSLVWLLNLQRLLNQQKEQKPEPKRFMWVYGEMIQSSAGLKPSVKVIDKRFNSILNLKQHETVESLWRTWISLGYNYVVNFRFCPDNVNGRSYVIAVDKSFVRFPLKNYIDPVLIALMAWNKNDHLVKHEYIVDWTEFKPIPRKMKGYT